MLRDAEKKRFALPSGTLRLHVVDCFGLNAVIDAYCLLPYVKSAVDILLTSSADDAAVLPVGEGADAIRQFAVAPVIEKIRATHVAEKQPARD
jgi:hypothetical protein